MHESDTRRILLQQQQQGFSRHSRCDELSVNAQLLVCFPRNEKHVAMHYGSVLGDSEVTLRAFEDEYHMSSTDTIFKHDISDILGRVLEMLAIRFLNIWAKSVTTRKSLVRHYKKKEDESPRFICLQY